MLCCSLLPLLTAPYSLLIDFYGAAAACWWCEGDCHLCPHSDVGLILSGGADVLLIMCRVPDSLPAM